MEEQHFPSRSDRHKNEKLKKEKVKKEKVKKEKPQKTDRSGIFVSKETEDLELTIGRDKAGRTLDDAWYMKYISETLEYYMYINDVEFRSDYIDTFEDVFITYDLKLEEKNKFQNFYENNFNCIVELFEYILDKIFNSDDFILNYDKMHAKINQCLN